jgi:hypothetical protein
MASPLSPLPLSGLTAGREALVLAADPGFIERTNPAHRLTKDALFRLFKQIITVDHTVEMNSHWFDTELEALGYKRLDLVQDHELDAMAEQVNAEYHRRPGPGANFPRDYAGFIERLKQDRAYRSTNPMLAGQIQEALVKINRVDAATGRHVRERRVYIFDQALTADTWEGFASRKPFFHAFAGTSLDPPNYHRAVSTTVRFRGADANVWPENENRVAASAFALGCHEVTYWLKRRLDIPPAQDPDTEVRCFGVGMRYMRKRNIANTILSHSASSVATCPTASRG